MKNKTKLPHPLSRHLIEKSNATLFREGRGVSCNPCRIKYTWKKILIICCCLVLSSCAGVQLLSHSFKMLIPWGGEETSTGVYKVGNPYVIYGVKYYPKEDWDYDERGVSSWYGGGDDDFHGKKTANGEIYNTRDLTAAHKTLPMPSFVKVTNLENGRRVILRINDRGPYMKGRIIDVSQKAAELLGFADKGTAKVRVQILGKESKAIADAAKRGRDISKVKFPKDTKDIDLANIEYMTPEQVQVVPVAPSNIYVQAGSFSVEKNAEKLKVDLSKLGSVRIEEALVNGVNYHRVQVGPIASVEEADAMLDVLSEMGIDSTKIQIK